MRVLILATTTGYQIRSFGEAAAALGVKLVFASDRCDQLEDPWWDAAIPIRFHDVERSAGQIVAALEAAPVQGVIAVGDRPAPLAARVAERLGLPGHPPEAAAASRNKLATRRALLAADMLVPRWTAVTRRAQAADAVHDVGFPAVLKPLALSASQGVIRVNDSDELEEALDRVRAILNAPDLRAEREALHAQLLIESFIPGREFAVEGLLSHGVFRGLAIFDKPDPLDGPFFEETIYVTPSRASGAEQRAILAAIEKAAAAIGLRHGAVHAECRVNALGVWVLEVAARPIGGLCSKALRFRSAGDVGRDVALEELLLRHALGEDVSAYEREAGASAVMMIPIPRRGVFKGVDGEGAARRVPGIDEIRITAKPDTVLVPLPEGHSYLGFIFAHGATPDAAEQSVRAAHALLEFQIDREVPVTS